MVGNMVKRHHGLGRFLGFIEPRGRGHRRIPNVLGVGWDGRNYSYWTIRARGPGGGGAYHHGLHRLAPSAGWMMDSIAQRMGPPYCD